MRIPIILISAFVSVALAFAIISGAGFGFLNNNDNANEIRLVNSEFTATVDHQVPKIRNMLRMDVYVKDAAKDVVDYLKLNVASDKEEFYKKTQSFRAFLSIYKDSNSDLEDQEAIGRLDKVFTDFESSGNDLIAIQDEQVTKIDQMQTLVNQRAEVTFNDLQKSLSPSEPDFEKKQTALIGMEAGLRKSVSSTMTYLVKPEESLKNGRNDGIRDFEYWASQFSSTQLTDQESTSIALLKKHFRSVKPLILDITALEDKKLELLAKFEVSEKKVVSILEDELESRAAQKIDEVKSASVATMRDVVQRGIITTDTRLIAMIAITISATILGLVISFSISTPITKLRDAFKEIAKGNFDVKVEPHGNKEISNLYKSFNSMIDKLKDRDKLQKEFISVASHELRSPIQPILSYASLAKKGQISDDQAWTSVLAQARRLQRLANDILYVTRIEAGDLTYAMMKVNLNEIILGVVNTEKVNLNEGVSIDVSLDDDVELYADTNRLTQALSNVIGNAAKFTKQGYIKVETNVLPRKNKVEIKVSDTAGGIPNDILPKLFGKFVTRSVGSDTKHGTGLGLYISKAIVTAHRGEISALNNDRGAAFAILLPVEKILQTKKSYLS